MNQSGVPVRIGDRVSVSFQVRGNGKIRIRIPVYSPQSATVLAMREAIVSDTLEISSENFEKKTVLIPLNGREKSRDISVALIDFISLQGSDVYFSDVSVSVLPKEKK